MSKIKDSFSKIKASDEFKDKLLIKLQANPVKLKPNVKKINYKPHIAVAAILFILIGIINFKLIINTFENRTNNLESISYAKKSEPYDDKAYTTESYEDNSKDEISTKTRGASVPSNTSKNNISSKANETHLTLRTIESNITSKTDVPINKNTIPEKVDSTNLDNIENSNNETVTSNNSVIDENKIFNAYTTINPLYVPKIQLPNPNAIATAKMMPLIVYKGNVYLYTPIEIPYENVKSLLGRKLGTTKDNLDEWSTQSDYSNEFASNIGATDVYSVNGYDEAFRIMTSVTIKDGKKHLEFYECLNGITIKNGADILEKLKLQDNITQAKFQTFSDWNNGTGTFYAINDSDLINNLLNKINYAIPYLPEDVEDSLGDYRNDDSYKQISFELKDGSKNVTFTILKSGYVYYGYPTIYFRIDPNFVEELWHKLSIISIN